VKVLNYKNTTVHYFDIGKGAAVVLLHGFLENQSMWNDFIPELSKRNRVITIDLLGHGATECMGYVHTMEDQADMVQAVLAELKIRKAVFVGHSMGGYIALAFAELFPEYMKGLVLMNSTSRADSEERKTNRDRAIKVVKKDHTSFIRLSIANLFTEENRTLLVDEVEKVKLEALKTPAQGIIAALEGMKMRKDREVLLHVTTFPKMLILGKKDGVLNYEENTNQIENTDVQLLSFSDGHMSQIENKAETLKAIIDFMKKI
jgi:pimeloyl-ACP methyl ester carboxylesterase